MKTYQCINGKNYELPDNCCIFCDKCSDIYCDSNGPFAIICTAHNVGRVEVQAIEFMNFIENPEECTCELYAPEQTCWQTKI